MFLEEEQRDKLYELLFYLLDYTNNKYKINKRLLNKLDGKTPIDPREIQDIRKRLWKDNSIIEEYIKKNSQKLNKKDLNIIESWKNRVEKKFIMAKHLKKHTIMMTGKEVYGIVGISNEISEIIPTSELPIFVETVLIPFEGVITYDSILLPYMISLGGGIRKQINEEYMKAKNDDKIIYSLEGNTKNIKSDKNTQTSKKYKYYEIKVSIRDTHPPVWRRLQIPSGITFHELNAIIQLAFDWCGYHMYEFEIGATLHEEGQLIGIPDEDSGWYGHEIKDAKKIKIDKYFKEYKKMKYTYDFGDNWIHDITIEKVIETDIKLQNPICIKAKMADLPEDCGGSWGYEELLEILDNPKHERYQEMKDWLENGYSNWNDDRTFVDLEQINMRLEDYKEHAKFLLGE